MREWVCRWERQGEEGVVEVCLGEGRLLVDAFWRIWGDGETYANDEVLWVNKVMLEDSVEDCAA